MDRPNVIFILVDDLGWRDLGFAGSPFYETPCLDRLAAQGMRFTDAYAAGPVCSPSRASLLTGRYPARVGITDYIGAGVRGRLLEAPYVDALPPSECSLARALAEGGYATWHVGKWHLGGPASFPERHGFDVNIGGCAWGHPHHGHWSPWGIPTLSESPPGTYLADRLTDEALALLRQPRDRPFFLNLWYYAVHTPLQAPEHLVDKYRRKARRLGLDRLPALESGEPKPFERAGEARGRVVRRRLQSDPVYAAMVENLDANVGRLLRGLEETGQVRNTLVVFSSDNGGLATSEGSPTCNAPLAEGKGWMYDGGMRVPLLVRWPGHVRPGSLCDVPVTGPDLYPTLLDAAALPPRPAQHCDGESLRPLLEERGALGRRAIFWHYPHYGNQGGTPGSAVRCGDHKLIEFFEDGRVELYDLRADVSESLDLADQRGPLSRELQAMLARWREDVAARLPQHNPDWRG